MPKYIIEREIDGVGDTPAAQLQAISQTSCNVLRELGPQIQWVESYVTPDKIYCVYIAPNEGADSRARDARRLSCQQHLRGQERHRPNHCGSLTAAQNKP